MGNFQEALNRSQLIVRGGRRLENGLAKKTWFIWTIPPRPLSYSFSFLLSFCNTVKPNELTEKNMKTFHSSNCREEKEKKEEKMSEKREDEEEKEKTLSQTHVLQKYIDYVVSS